jgi:adenylate kinase
MDNKKAIIILGAPGSGKGTQANLLAEKFGFYHLETSKLLEKLFRLGEKQESVDVDGKKYYFRDEKKLYDEGKLCDPPFVFFVMQEKIKEILDGGEGVILSGSPRTLFEAEKMMPFLERLCYKDNIKVFFLALNLEQSVWRNSHRRICELMRHSILYTEETKKLNFCPLDGSKLGKRELDDPAMIEKRFGVFEKETIPAVEYIKKNGFDFHEINGLKSVAGVFADILKSLE